MKKKNQDPRQLELWSNFAAAKDGVTAALEKLGETMSALVAENMMSPRQAIKETKKVSKQVVKQADLRKRLNAIVRAQARAKKLHWREVFRLVYTRLLEATGFNSEAKAVAVNGRQIDVIEQAGLLGKTVTIASNL